MIKENLFESSVSFFIWPTRGFAGKVPGHVAMRMHRPNLVTELPQRGLMEAGKLVADGMRSARLNNTEHPDLASKDVAAYDGVMAAQHQLYLSFWPGGTMPQTYIEDTIKETGENAQKGLGQGRKLREDIEDSKRYIEDLNGNLQNATNEKDRKILSQTIKRAQKDLEKLYSHFLQLEKTTEGGERWIHQTKDFTDRKGITHKVFNPQHRQVIADRLFLAERKVDGVFDSRGNQVWETYYEPDSDNADTYHTRYLVDRNFGTQAEVFHTLPCMTTQSPENPRNPVWGLSVIRMAKWWNAFLDENLHTVFNTSTGHEERYSAYKLESKTHNCAGACAGALRAGGAEAFVPFTGSAYVIATTPNDIDRWVKALDMRITQLNGMTKNLLAVIDSYKPKPGSNSPFLPVHALIGANFSELWSLEDFKAATNLKTSIVKINVRHGAITNIDTQLAKYHRIPWSNHQLFPEKLRCMVNIVSEAHDYFQKYKNNPDEAKRGAGVTLLVKQVFSVMKSYEHQ